MQTLKVIPAHAKMISPLLAAVLSAPEVLAVQRCRRSLGLRKLQTFSEFRRDFLICVGVMVWAGFLAQWRRLVLGEL